MISNIFCSLFCSFICKKKKKISSALKPPNININSRKINRNRCQDELQTSDTLNGNSNDKTIAPLTIF